MRSQYDETNEKKKEIRSLVPADKWGFFQSKYDYYRGVTRYITLLTVLSNIFYFIADWYLAKHFMQQTLLFRLMPAIAFVPYIIQDKRVRDWDKIFFLPYICAHLCVLSTIMANGAIVGRNTTTSVFILMQFAFVGLGFGTPFIWHVLMYVVFFAELFVANSFFHFHQFNETIALSLPVLIGAILTAKAIESAYTELYNLKKQLWHMTMTDPLTEVNNRNKLRDILIKDTKRLKWREKTAIAMFDVDHFKNVNDTYGHDAGDEILKLVAKTLTSHVRQSDYVIRWGGEEFVIVLPNSSEKTAFDIAERIRNKIQALDTGICPITVSAGVSQYNGDDFEESVENADAALYYAKEHGRNQTILYRKIEYQQNYQDN